MTTVPARAAASDWIAGARPRTLPVAVVPVAVGTAAAAAAGSVVWWRCVLALVVSLAIQIGTNYANDYSDGVRGTDTVRVGPRRLVAGGIAPAGAVRRAALASFLLAACVGLVLAVATSPYLIAIGAACMAAGWFYTGGRRPYGYIGLGEVFVFVFFGLVAVMGTTYVASERLTALSAVAAVPVGLFAVALLVVNNLRDLDNDAASGKRTLAVRLGDRRTRACYEGCLAASFVAIVGAGLLRPGAFLALAALPLALIPARLVRKGAEGPRLVEALGMTGRLELVAGLLLALGIALL